MIVTTPKYERLLPEKYSCCDVCTAIDDMLDTVVIKGAVDIATEIRHNFREQQLRSELSPVHPKTPEANAGHGSETECTSHRDGTDS